ncbi:MAG: RagB/SusD family nutrient uptake outer membrane protein [Prevotellaceae bacterium]|nr:RagB/SusD family nutrient uptake outer membrane protein [Prevotellaceae bacterium]
MKNIKKYISIIVAIAVLSGCEDFLNPEQKNAISPDNFPSTVEQVQLQVDASNLGIRSVGLYAFYWYPMIVYLLDHTSDTYGSYDERGSSMRNYTDIDNRYITQLWMDVFKSVTLANTALQGIESYRAKHAMPSEKEAGGILDYLEGQAHFNRAIAYWHGQVFCEISPDGRGLPVIDKLPSGYTEMKVERRTTRETYDFMIEDFRRAAELLAGRNDDKKVPTEWAAKAMLAKALMQAGKNADAIPVLKDIIDNSGKSLVPFGIYENMFYGDAANEFNSESLYELDQTTNLTQNGPWGGYTSGNGMAMVFSPWSMDLNIRFRNGNENRPERNPLVNSYDINTSIMGGWGNNYIHDGNIRRFGYTGMSTPRRTFNPDYNFNAERSIDNYPYAFAEYNSLAQNLKDSVDKYNYYLNPNYRQECLDLKNDKSVCDPRLKISTGQPLVDIFIDDFGRQTFYDRSGEINNYPDVLGFEHRKYTNINGTEAKINYSSAANIYVARLADIYLLYAEAMKDENPSVALEYLNKVHRRAYGYAPDAASPYDYTSLSARTKTVDATDHLANDPLKYERWAELFAEGDWWFSIRRWQTGRQETDYYKQTRVGAIEFIEGAYYVLPVPKIELERNPNLKQSTGYSDVR